MDALKTVETKQLKDHFQDFRPGDTVTVHVNVTEGDKTRDQLFKGTCIQRHGTGIHETFTVRKVSHGVSV